MTISILGDLPKGICITCGTYKIARIRIESHVDGFDNSIKEIQWRMDCSECVMMFRRIEKYNKQIKELKNNILDENFTLFCRKFN